MSSWKSSFRTNYFTVTDEDRFLRICYAAGFPRIVGNDRDPREKYIWCQTDKHGVKRYGFGCSYDNLEGLVSPMFKHRLELDDYPGKREDGSFDEDIAREGSEEFEEYVRTHDIEEDEMADYSFCEALQEIIPDEEAVVIMEAGIEGLRYVGADAWIITNDDIDTTSLELAIKDILQRKFGEKFETQLSY